MTAATPAPAAIDLPEALHLDEEHVLARDRDHATAGRATVAGYGCRYGDGVHVHAMWFDPAQWRHSAHAWHAFLSVTTYEPEYRTVRLLDVQGDSAAEVMAKLREQLDAAKRVFGPKPRRRGARHG